MNRAALGCAGLAVGMALAVPLHATAGSLSTLTLPSYAPAAPIVLQAHAETLLPAPVPNRDIGPPSETLSAQADPSLEPGVFNPRSHFAGDGYASGSNIEADQNHRHTLGAGMNLSVPVP